MDINLKKYNLTYEDLFITLHDIANDGYWIWYIKENYEYLSPRFKNILGYAEDEMENHPSSWQKLIYPEYLDIMYKKVEEAIKHDSSFIMNIKYKHKEGHDVWINCRGQVIKRSDEGDALIMMGTHTDITDLKILNENLISANNIKSKFLALMSHEIRTPLTGILGITEILLQNKNLDENVSKDLEKIKNCGEHLHTILNDILDYAKLDADKIVLEDEILNIKNIVDECTGLLYYKSVGKNLEIIKNIDIKNDYNHIGDKTRIKQIIFNLLNNAIKFTNHGCITINVAVEQNKEKDIIHLVIEDTGIGIQKDKIKLLFTPFTQIVDTKIRSNNEGTGLGLSIVKLLAEKMDGKVWVESVFGKGSKFNVNLKLKRNNVISDKKGIIDNVSSIYNNDNNNVKNILIVEDNFINRDLIKSIIDKFTYFTYDECENGKEAIEMFKNRNYDLILMDAYMPVMNGTECTKYIRTLDNNIPIIGLTADAFDRNRKDCISSGMNNVLTKPINIEKFISTINNYLL